MKGLIYLQIQNANRFIQKFGDEIKSNEKFLNKHKYFKKFINFESLYEHFYKAALDRQI